MAAPETTAKQGLMAVLAAAYPNDGFPIKDDHLHESLGHKGTIIGVSVERTVTNPANNTVSDIELKVQFYGKYEKKINPEQVVSGTPIETRAEAFRKALRVGDPNTDAVWYYSLTRVEFPKDPTGNKTRYEAFVTAKGNNTALIETAA